MKPPHAPADTRVDAIVEALLVPREVPENTRRLKTLGAAAVPRLLQHLEEHDRRRRTIAFFGLQQCWTAAALAPVTTFLADDDDELRRMAAIVLVKGAGYDALIERCLPLLDHPKPAVRAFALDHVESERPDLERTRRLLWDADLGPALLPHLPRYHAPYLSPALLHWFDRAPSGLMPALLAALIHINADHDAIRERVIGRLDDPEPLIRAAAAEYLAWHGAERDRSALDQAERRERARNQPRLAAGCAAALAMIAGRPSRPPASAPERPVAAAERAAAYRRLAAALAGDGATDPQVAAEAWALYRYGEAAEPHWAYRGVEPVAAFVADRQARLALQARLFAVPGAVVPGSQDRDVRCAPPAAEDFVAPVLGYDPGAKSNFGLTVAETAIEGFNGLVHVGDDTAWHQPHAPVHAIAAGIVRAVGCSATWGVAVVIEHREPGGRSFCSVYGHLAPLVTVRAGDRIAAGHKLGAVGRSYTWENGGYAAHLHFGLHDGPYVQWPRPGQVIDVRYQGKPYRGTVIHGDAETTLLRITTAGGPERIHKASDWMAGYVSTDWFEAGDHGWLEPRGFLGRRGVAL